MRRSLRLASAAGCCVGLAAGGVAYAAMYPTSQIFGRVLIAGDDPNEIALTYDDGPNPSATPQLLELLARRGVSATFFLIGRYVRQQGRLAREIASAGHLIGNHTMTHPRLAWLPAARIRSELAEANAAIEDAIGAPVRYLRPPHGARRPFVLRAAHELGLETVQWNVTAHDWEPIGARRIAENVLRGVRRNEVRSRGTNILLHDGSQFHPAASRLDSVAATGSLLDALPGKRFVTVAAWDHRGQPSA